MLQAFGTMGIRKLLGFIATEAEISIYNISIARAFVDRWALAFISTVSKWTEPSNACQTASFLNMIKWKLL